jgi:hypothetical protein
MSNGGTLSARLISLIEALQRVHVRAGAESAAGAGEHDDAHAVVFCRRLHGVTHVALHDRRPRIHAVGPIERDGRDLLVHVIENVLIGHGDLLAVVACRDDVSLC